MKKILVLSANPKNTDRLRLDEEVREIQAGLERARKRDQFVIVTQSALRPHDLLRALLDHEPQIIHFCGHGIGEQGLVLENDSGQAQLITAASLAELFKQFENTVECVVLNACYSDVQAEAIHQHIDCVIGMNRAIGDRAAIQFALGFYDAVGAGKPYDQAYGLGRSAMSLEGITESSTPVIRYRQRPITVEEPAESKQEHLPAGQAGTVTMTATGDNAKQIGQIGRIENLTM